MSDKIRAYAAFNKTLSLSGGFPLGLAGQRNVAGECDVRSLGAGRAKLRLSRGFPLGLTGQLHPQNSRSDCLSLPRHAKILNFLRRRIFCITPRLRIS
jgi:hypothetical protein